ncbi:MAG: biotin transporter BioY [Chloroflexi bacterium]|nr:biotin transporter BioY [Chloroflexota bacterium]
MLRTLPQIRYQGQVYRLAAAAVFTLLTILSARVTIETGLVPFTLQPLAVLLAGLTLGARDGAISQVVYVALIAAGLPLDARGLGAAALFGPTGGYLIGFVAAAAAAGWLAERGGSRLWQRWLAGVAGIAVLYLFGVAHLQMYAGMDWSAAWAAGGAPFLLPDLAKAVIAAALAEGGRKVLLWHKSTTSR